MCLAQQAKESDLDDGPHLLSAGKVVSQLRAADAGWDVREHDFPIDSVDLRTSHRICWSKYPYVLSSDEGIQVKYFGRSEYDGRSEDPDDTTCDRNDIQVTVPAEGRFQVRLWSYNGFREELNFYGGGTEGHATLSWEPKNSDGEYFARLFEVDNSVAPDDYEAVSSVYEIETFAACDRNRVRLTFLRLDAESP